MRRWNGDFLYEAFEHAVMAILTVLLVVMIAFATGHLVYNVGELILGDQLNPSDPGLYPDIFSLIFTILIGFEFKHSFLNATATQTSVIRIRSIILIGMLATVRRIIILDLTKTDVAETLAAAGCVLALGIVYWLVRSSETHNGGAPPHAPPGAGRLDPRT